MQTRSGRVLPELKVDLPPKVSKPSTNYIPKYSIQNPKYAHIAEMTHPGDPRDIFEIVLDKGVGTNKWPCEHCGYFVSTDSLDPKDFEEHLRWLMSHMKDGFERSKKANRLVLMATTQSLMNVAHDETLRNRFRPLAELCIKKLEDVDHEVHEFNLPQYIAEFKSFVR